MACVFSGTMLFSEATARNKSYSLRKADAYDEIETSYASSEEYRDQLKDMYEELCILGICELANCDEEMNYMGNKYIMSDLLYYLDYNHYGYKKTDKGIRPVSDMFDYYVSYTRPRDAAADELSEDEESTDSEMTAEETAEEVQAEDMTLFATNLTSDVISEGMTEKERLSRLQDSFSSYILRADDVMTSDMTSSGSMLYYSYKTVEDGKLSADYTDEAYPDNFLPMGGWYHDSYGRYVFNFGNHEPIRFFAYPETTEEGRIARQEYTDIKTDTVIYEPEIYDTMWQNEEGVFYSRSIFEMPDYKAYAGETSGLTVFIAPKAGLLEEYSTAYAREVSEYELYRNIETVSAVLALLMILYLAAAAVISGLCREEGQLFSGRVPIEFLLLAFVLISSYLVSGHIYSYSSFTQPLHSITRSALIGNVVYFAAGLLLSAADIFILMQILRTVFGGRLRKSFGLPKLIRRLTNYYHSTAIYQKIRLIPAGEKLKRRTINTFIICGIAVAAVIVLIAAESWDFEGVVLLLIFAAGVYTIYMLVRNLFLAGEISKLEKRIDALKHDEPFDEEIADNSEIKADIDKLESISEAVNEAVEERLKSERMKIELVANVSHDLKTPLTSIISYIDLLKKSELDDEAAAYVEILDKKSQKLKSIVADVFSLAKATSGIDVNMEELDFVMLFNQSYADAEDKISSSGKTIKLTVTEQTAPVMGDGAKLYRVLQNLIDNALKYSMEGSRIFLELTRKDNSVVFIAKNTSSYPIDFTADEITERFVRGDKSRTDGGSGLGLSIAKSFTEACGGTFDIELDGDMFKAILTLPIREIKEEEKNEEKDIL